MTERSDLIACRRPFTEGEIAERFQCGAVARYVSLDGTPLCVDCGARSKDLSLIDIDSPQGHHIIAMSSASIEVPT